MVCADEAKMFLLMFTEVPGKLYNDYESVEHVLSAMFMLVMSR